MTQIGEYNVVLSATKIAYGGDCFQSQTSVYTIIGQQTPLRQLSSRFGPVKLFLDERKQLKEGAARSVRHFCAFCNISFHSDSVQLC